jgi:hypothetical protein
MELAPGIPDPHAVMIRVALQAGDDAAAKEAAEKILQLEPERKTVIEYFTSLRQRYPDRSLWSDLASQYPQLLPPPTSAPAGKQQ